MARNRAFGSIRRLISGRYSARYNGPDMMMHAAPLTFTTKIDAEAWLAAERRISDNPTTWRPPKVRLQEENDHGASSRSSATGSIKPTHETPGGYGCRPRTPTTP